MERILLLLFLFLPFCFTSQAQQIDLIDPADYYILDDVKPDLSLETYDRFNHAIGGDSIRICGEFPCIGWVEDKWENGVMKHRGYYDAGKLVIYKNYHPSGDLEREYKGIDARKSVMRTFFSGAGLRSETKYVDGNAIEYKEHYVNGKLRYHEEKHRSQPYYLRMDLYAADGHPISLMQLIDKKKVEFEIKEYHPGGALKCEGRARYDPSRMDSQRIAVWRTYDKAGALLREEAYQDGRISQVK